MGAIVCLYHSYHGIGLDMATSQTSSPSPTPSSPPALSLSSSPVIIIATIINHHLYNIFTPKPILSLTLRAIVRILVLFGFVCQKEGVGSHPIHKEIFQGGGVSPSLSIFNTPQYQENSSLHTLNHFLKNCQKLAESVKSDSSLTLVGPCGASRPFQISVTAIPYTIQSSTIPNTG